ncbi:Photosystem II PsbQ [Cinnamomum micranthum f. kanehirae]|uniref:Photosystem II PsbQ n=1 Tax=Cinnamomum micranthum f. kanehirae TaxID=337451 RepID=A0A443P0P1_9MAGN|nr:Photosystem II PsbQ [Cinnamomum micranthum f. kanehirae]
MALLSTCSAASDILLPKFNIFEVKRTRTLTIMGSTPKKAEEFPQLAQSPSENGLSIQSTRRAVVGLGLLAISMNYSESSLADGGNGWWIDGPLPIPPVYNKIANEETGTRSFIKNGVYMADIGPEGSAYRLRKYAFDLLALEDLLGQDAWSHVRRYLRLKSTFISPSEQKQPLTDLANRLFDKVEKLEDAVKKHNELQTTAYYEDTKAILEEVMVKMA